MAKPQRVAQVFVVMVCASLLIMTVWRISVARTRELEDSRVQTATLGRSLADNAHSTFEAADILLTGLVERVEVDGTSDPAMLRLHRMMATRLASVSRIRDLGVVGADGRRLATSAPGNDIGGDVSDREFFAFHRTHAGRGSHIGPPIQSRVSGAWVIPVSRRIDHPDGSFGGIALALINLASFEAFYATLDVGPHGLIALTNDDGTMLVRVPFIAGYSGKNLAAAPFFREYRERGPVGNSEGPSISDGVFRLRSFRRVDDYPLVVFVAQARLDVLANWRSSAWTAIATSSAVALILGVFGWRMAGQIRLRAEAEVAVRLSERQYRLLADNSTDLITQLDHAFRRVYVSPSSMALTGYAPDELIGGSPLELANPEDRPALQDNFATLGTVGTAPPLIYRIRHKAGHEIWVELIGRKLQDGDGFVFAVRDVARRKQAEDKLHAANNQLQQIAMMDGLTGIANRRCFDSVLTRELRRGARTELPLALLILDVDHFKAFNDTYGHPAGDACLRAIAGAVAALMQRPADLAARYGGEEFAALLPETDEAGALEMAERVRVAVRALNVAHRHGVDGIATVSIGVAVIRPRPAGGDGPDLVTLADTALYRAKKAGRDRVCVADARVLDPAAVAAAVAVAF